jgi:hypothetical protein
MRKYQLLADHFAASPGDEWRTSFAELEAVLGFALPKVAREGRSWWVNDPQKSHSRAWAGQGWQVADVDLAAEQVAFRRKAPAAPPPAGGAVQPAAMREAAESASTRMQVSRAARAAALLTAGAAVAAGVATALVRAMRRK